MRFNKSLLCAAAAAVALSAATPAMTAEVKMGVLLGYTGPLEALAPPIGDAAQLAWQNVNDQGGLLDGDTITAVTGDSTCADATAAANAADRLINTDGVLAIVGAMCSGATISAANSAGVPTNTVMISPSATAPTVSDVDDNDLLFRTAPPDSDQGSALASLLMAKGVSDIAITYVNNDYGKGFADFLAAAYADMGGTVSANEAHEEGKADYRAELGQLAASGSQTLVVLAYAQGSGQTILRQAIESGDFTQYVGGDGMISDALFTGFDAPAGMIGTQPGAPEPGASLYVALAEAAGLEVGDIYSFQGYDAAFLLALAIEKNGAADRDGLSAALREVANAPGEVIRPGEWEKAKALIAAGTDINYEGAAGTNEFDAEGDVAGTIFEMTVEDGSWVQVAPIDTM